MAQKYQFANFPLPLVTQASVPSGARIGSASTPARHGEYAGKRYLAARQVKISGVLIGADYSDLQNKWSQFCAAHNLMSPAPLFCGLEDRFLYAVAESLNDTSRGVDAIEWDATYVAHDPHFYSVSEQNISVSNPTSFAVSTNGNANALPRITFNISAAPAGSTISLSNTTTGETCILRPTTATPIIIDSRLETVTSGAILFVADQMGVFSGRFLSLKGGPLFTDKTSSLTLSTTGGAAVSSLLINFRDRSI